MSGGDPVKKLLALVKRLRARLGEVPMPIAPAWEGADPVACELVFALLLSDNSADRARRSFEALKEAFVDLNELRIALPDEIAEHIGEPGAQERAARIKAALLDVFRREHVMSLAPLLEAGKRECRAYLDGLDGASPFAIARLKLTCLNSSCVPVDGSLLARLREEGAVSEETSEEDACEWIARQLEPGQASATHALFQAWLAEAPAAARGGKAKPDRAGAKDPAAGAKSRASKDESAAEVSGKDAQKDGSSRESDTREKPRQGGAKKSRKAKAS